MNESETERRRKREQWNETEQERKEGLQQYHNAYDPILIGVCCYNDTRKADNLTNAKR